MTPEDEANGDEWSEMGLEEAYLRALETNDAVEWEIGLPSEPTDEGAVAEHETELSLLEGTEDSASDDDTPADADADAANGGVDELSEVIADSDSSDVPTRVTPKQVIEATLFVGGSPLTAKKLCYLMKGDADLDFIEQAIDDLNHQYIDECRPYEIRLSEGGYRIVLHEEFQRLRNRVYGIGPREVRLSQDVLEVLALVAYRQPITLAKMEEFGKSNAAPVLRQLLRRELISLERDPADRKLVRYRTTRRFLSVFGLGSLDDLPQAEDLMFK